MALDRVSGSITILAFGLLFLSILLSARSKGDVVEPFQATGVSLSGFQAKTVPLEYISGTTKRIYSDDGTLLWVQGVGYVLPDDPTYKQGAPYYTESHTVIVLFQTLESMGLDAMKALETSGTADDTVYGSTIIADLMRTNKIAEQRVVLETSSGAVQYTDGTAVVLKTPPYALPAGVSATVAANTVATSTAATGTAATETVAIGTVVTGTAATQSAEQTTGQSGGYGWLIGIFVLIIFIVVFALIWKFGIPIQSARSTSAGVPAGYQSVQYGRPSA